MVRVAGIGLVLAVAIVTSRRCAECGEPSAPDHEAPCDSTVVRAEAPVTTLDGLVALALERNPRLRAAAAAVEEAQGLALQAGLYPNPTVEGGAEEWNGTQSKFPVIVRQEIVTAGKLRLDRTAAAQQALEAELNHEAIRYQMLTAVREQFYRVLAAQRRVEILGRLVGIARQSEKTARQLLDAGEGNRSDLLQLTVELRRAEVDLRNAQTMLAADRHRLTAIAGVPGSTIAAVQGDLQAALPEFDEEEALHRILERHAELRHSRVESERSWTLLRRARAEPIPNVTLGAGYKRDLATRLEGEWILEVECPLPVWNRNQGNIRAARAAVTRTAEAADALANSLREKLAQAIGEYRSACQLASQFDSEILPASQESLRIVQVGYAQGQFDFLRMLEAQRTLIQAELGAIDAQRDRWTAAARIAGLLQLDVLP